MLFFLVLTISRRSLYFYLEYYYFLFTWPLSGFLFTAAVLDLPDRPRSCGTLLSFLVLLVASSTTGPSRSLVLLFGHTDLQGMNLIKDDYCFFYFSVLTLSPCF